MPLLPSDCVFVLSEVRDAPYYHCKGTSTIAVTEGGNINHTLK